MKTIILQGRLETIVKLPVEAEDNQGEGILEKRKLEEGIYVANSLTTVTDGYVITSILNTTEQEIKLPEPKLKLAKLEALPVDKGELGTKRYKD
jgi:hypothetical protein